MKATEQYSPVEPFIVLYVVLTFVDEILKCDHSNRSYQAELSCRNVQFIFFKVEIGRNELFLPSSNFVSGDMVLMCAFVDEFLRCGLSNESYSYRGLMFKVVLISAEFVDEVEK